MTSRLSRSIIASTVGLLMLALAFHLVVDRIVTVAVVAGESMAPLLTTGDIVFVDRMSTPAPGDIVAFRAPADWDTPHEILIKRVIAVGGQQVACCIAHHIVTVDSVPQPEPYLAEPARYATRMFDRAVPADGLWAMGDNRLLSVDSSSHLHSTGGGAIPLDLFVGIVHLPPR